MGMKKLLFRQAFFLLPLTFLALGLTWFFPAGSYIDYFALVKKESVQLAFLMELITDYLSYFIYFFFLWYVFRSQKNDFKKLLFFYLIINALLSTFTVNFLKEAIGKPRPFLGEVSYQPFTDNKNYHSFPSAHTADTGNSAGVLSQYFGSHFYSFCLGFLPALMAFSRIFLGRHYLSDIFGAAVVSSFFVLLTSYLWHTMSLQGFSTKFRAKTVLVKTTLSSLLKI